MATLGFSTKWPEHMGGEPTYFIQKIWRSETLGVNNPMFYKYWSEYQKKMNKDWDAIPVENAIIPKLHTIRHDPKNLWAPGRKIHMVVFNRSKNRFQFAPVLECKSVQEIDIKITKHTVNVYIDKQLYHSTLVDFVTDKAMKQLALNDGFESVEHFFQWFNTDSLPGTKIIHWTNLKY